jgi:hypothetical protein
VGLYSNGYTVNEESWCYSAVAKTKGFFAINRKLSPNPPFFFYFSQTLHHWFSSYLTHASSSSPGFFLFFFSSSPSPLTHASSPGFFLFFFFFFFTLTSGETRNLVMRGPNNIYYIIPLMSHNRIKMLHVYKIIIKNNLV